MVRSRIAGAAMAKSRCNEIYTLHASASMSGSDALRGSRSKGRLGCLKQTIVVAKVMRKKNVWIYYIEVRIGLSISPETFSTFLGCLSRFLRRCWREKERMQERIPRGESERMWYADKREKKNAMLSGERNKWEWSLWIESEDVVSREKKEKKKWMQRFVAKRERERERWE